MKVCGIYPNDRAYTFSTVFVTGGGIVTIFFMELFQLKRESSGVEVVIPFVRICRDGELRTWEIGEWVKKEAVDDYRYNP